MAGITPIPTTYCRDCSTLPAVWLIDKCVYEVEMITHSSHAIASSVSYLYYNSLIPNQELAFCDFCAEPYRKLWEEKSERRRRGINVLYENLRLVEAVYPS